MARKKLDVQRSSHTLPPSPTHSFSSSSSSSDFEFITISSASPRKSSAPPPLCRTADELFYKGQLLPLHLSPRLSMVRTLLLLPSSSTSSSSACSSYAASDTTASRDSTGSSSRDSSARPSSVLEEFDEFKRLNNTRLSSSSDVVVKQVLHSFTRTSQSSSTSQMKKNNSNNKYFSLSRFSSVFKKDQTKQQHNRIVVEEPDHNNGADNASGSRSVKRAGNTAKEVIRRYMKKVKPLYEKLSQKQQKMTTSAEIGTENKHRPINSTANRERITTTSINGLFSHSFTGNFKRRGSCVASCPSSMRCSPNHSGVLSRTGKPVPAMTSSSAVDRSSMEELQSAIQGAIAHCKNSQNNKTMFSNEI